MKGSRPDADGDAEAAGAPADRSRRPSRTLRWAVAGLAALLLYLLSPVPASWLLQQLAARVPSAVFDPMVAAWNTFYAPLILLSERWEPAARFYERYYEFFDSRRGSP